MNHIDDLTPEEQVELALSDVSLDIWDRAEAADTEARIGLAVQAHLAELTGKADPDEITDFLDSLGLTEEEHRTADDRFMDTVQDNPDLSTLWYQQGERSALTADMLMFERQFKEDA